MGNHVSPMFMRTQHILPQATDQQSLLRTVRRGCLVGHPAGDTEASQGSCPLSCQSRGHWDLRITGWWAGPQLPVPAQERDAIPSSNPHSCAQGSTIHRHQGRNKSTLLFLSSQVFMVVYFMHPGCPQSMFPCWVPED